MQPTIPASGTATCFSGCCNRPCTRSAAFAELEKWSQQMQTRWRRAPVAARHTGRRRRDDRSCRARESESIILPGAEILVLGDPAELEVVVEMLSADAVQVRSLLGHGYRVEVAVVTLLTLV